MQTARQTTDSVLVLRVAATGALSAKGKSLREAVEEGDVLGYEEEQQVMGVLGVVGLVSGPFLLVRSPVLASLNFGCAFVHGVHHTPHIAYPLTPNNNNNINRRLTLPSRWGRSRRLAVAAPAPAAAYTR